MLVMVVFWGVTRENPKTLTRSSNAELAVRLEHWRDTTYSYLAICAIVKDQGKDVLEWALYHLMLGTGIIYIYDHNSSTPLVKELHPLIASGQVAYRYFR